MRKPKCKPDAVFRAKSTVDQLAPIDIRQLQREGLLVTGESHILSWRNSRQALGSLRIENRNEHFLIEYEYHDPIGSSARVSQVAWIESTNCNYGGSRQWFICPTKGCNRRVAILYPMATLACRNCLELSYQSQRENCTDRALRRAQNIRKKLGGSSNIFGDFPVKPMRMRWATYCQLRSEAQFLEQQCLSVLSALLPRNKTA